MKSNIFYDPYTEIYEVIENLNNRGMIANPITLKIFLKKIICSVRLEHRISFKLTRFSSSVKKAIDYGIHEMYLDRN